MGKSIYELYQESNPQNLKESFLIDVLDELMEEGLIPYVEDLKVSNEDGDPLENILMSLVSSQ